MQPILTRRQPKGTAVRRIVFLLVLGLVLISIGEDASAQSARDWVTMAEEQYRAGDYAASADSFGESIRAGAKHANTYYNAACSSALAGRIDEAFDRLDEALSRGLRNADFLAGDTDLNLLHGDPRWDAAIARCQQADVDYLASMEKPELRAELLEMRRIDQAIRRGDALPELVGRTMGDVDAENTTRMQEILAEHGWPTVSMVGTDGSQAAWILVQHADADPEFQRWCLDLMREEPAGGVDPIDLAYLTDRVRVNEGKPQLYGTQFWMVDGELVPRPIEDEEGLEARRAELGMISMEEYTARMTGN